MFSRPGSTVFRGRCTTLAVLIALVTSPVVARERQSSDYPDGNALNIPVQIFASDTGYLEQFGEAYAPDVKLRVFVSPSWAASHAVGIRQTNDTFTVFGLQRANRASLWELALAAWNHRLPELSKGIESRVWRCEARIDAALVNRLMRVSETMLSKEFLKDAIGLDGEMYFVDMPTTVGIMQGQTWSPESGSRSGLFTDIVDTLGRYCVWGGYFHGQQLDERIQALESKLTE